jgi:RNA polymerase sigma-70 factor (ECF subfamily)
MQEFDAIMSEYIDRIYGFAYRMTGDAALAEDVAQDTFVKAWKAYGRFEEGRQVKPWLFAIAKNAAIDALRKRRDIPFAALSDDEGPAFEDTVADDAPLALESFERDEVAGALERAIQGLSPSSRAVVLMRDREDMTFEEMGEALGEPMNTVKSRYRRALEALRKELGGGRGKGGAPKRHRAS